MAGGRAGCGVRFRSELFELLRGRQHLDGDGGSDQWFFDSSFVASEWSGADGDDPTDVHTHFLCFEDAKQNSDANGHVDGDA